MLDNFLDGSYLADGKASLHLYLAQRQPPLDWRNDTSVYGCRNA